MNIRHSICITLLIVLARLLSAEEQLTKVVGVHDGDTISVLTTSKTELKIRLAGIDAPELKQAFGSKARQALSGMIFGKTVRLVISGKDHYGRSLAEVYTLDNTFINLEMVKLGYAWDYVRFTKGKLFKDAEAAARAGRKGLWQDDKPIPPWEWRKEEK